MAGLKSLAKETAIYGVSSIVGRFLNYLLVPVYTIALPASSGGYEYICLGGIDTGIADVWHGDGVFPFCQ